MGNGDTSVGGGGDGRGHAGHNLEGDAGSGESLSLLTTAAEHEGIAALESHDGFTGESLGDEQVVDFGLAQGLAPALLADEDRFGIGRQLQQRRIQEAVVDDYVGHTQHMLALASEEPGVAGAGADQVDLANRHDGTRQPARSSPAP